MPPTFISFEERSPYAALVWDHQAIAATPDNIEGLAQRFDEVKKTNKESSKMGFTVRALVPEKGVNQVVEFTYPIYLEDQIGMDPPADSNTSGSKHLITEMVKLFQQYLSSYDSPTIEILVLQKHETATLPESTEDVAILDNVASQQDLASLLDTKSSDPQNRLNVGAIVGSVDYPDPAGRPQIQLHEPRLTGHHMEMVLGSDGFPVRLHPSLNNTPSEFHTFRSYRTRDRLSKSVIQSEAFPVPETRKPLFGQSIKF